MRDVKYISYNEYEKKYSKNSYGSVKDLVFKNIESTAILGRGQGFETSTCLPIPSLLSNPLYPEKIIYNGPATIVFWKDGTKTVVKAMDGVDANPYHGFTAALAKKIYGSSSKVNKIVGKYAPEDKMSTDGKIICYEPESCRYLETTMKAIRKVERLVLFKYWMSLNEIYSELGLAYSSPLWDEVGFCFLRPLKFDIKETKTPHGERCYILRLATEPIRKEDILP